MFLKKVLIYSLEGLLLGEDPASISLYMVVVVVARALLAKLVASFILRTLSWRPLLHLCHPKLEL